MGNNVSTTAIRLVFLHDTWKISNLTLDLGARMTIRRCRSRSATLHRNTGVIDTSSRTTQHRSAPRLCLGHRQQRPLRVEAGRQVSQFLPSILLAIRSLRSPGSTTISVTCSASNPCPVSEPSTARIQSLRPVLDEHPTVSGLEAQESLRTIIGFEQQLGESYSVGIEGTYSDFSKQQGQININAMPTGVVFGNLRQFNVTNPNRPYPEFQDVTQHVSDAEASYKALTVSTRKMAMANSKISWLAHYTWSEAIDQDSTSAALRPVRLDPFNPRSAKGCRLRITPRSSSRHV